MMLTGAVKCHASSVELTEYHLTMEPNEITLPFKGGTDRIINCARNESNQISFAIWLRSTNFDEIRIAGSSCKYPVNLTSACAKLPIINHGTSLKCTITPSLIRFKVMNALLKCSAKSSFAGECSSSIAKTIDTRV